MKENRGIQQPTSCEEVAPQKRHGNQHTAKGLSSMQMTGICLVHVCALYVVATEFFPGVEIYTANHT